MGVNMPARTVAFDSTRKHDGVKMRDLLPGMLTSCDHNMMTGVLSCDHRGVHSDGRQSRKERVGRYRYRHHIV